MSMRLRHLLLFLTLAMLSVRALTPLGYMPASAGTGLLYELCPEGIPAEIMRSLGGHHHHHGGHDGKNKAGPSESCPIGHMLASAIAVDLDIAAVVPPSSEVFVVSSIVAIDSRASCRQRCRSPPACEASSHPILRTAVRALFRSKQ